MDILIEVFQYPWALRALLASILVGISCGVLGSFVVLRNMSLIGDALSHSILPGIVLAFVIVGYSAIGFFTGAVIAGLVTAVAIILIQDYFSTKADAAVGIVFTTMFALGVMGISRLSSQQGIHLDLKDFLFGNILGVSAMDLVLTTMVCLFTIAGIILFYRQLFITTFQPIVADTMGISSTMMKYFLMVLLSFTVVAALQVVGVILVVSMLITPAATALLLSDNLKKVIFISAGVGCASAIIGLFLAIILEIPPGPSMAVTVAAMYLLAGLAAPQKGLFRKMLTRRRSRQQVQREDVLKNLYKLLNRGTSVALDTFSIEGIPQRRLKTQINLLIKKGLIRKKEGLLELTNDGSHAAAKLVRAHRLWESYLAGEMGLTASQIHSDAEKFEHILTDELLDEVEKTLGFPEKDPHGSPIPLKANVPAYSIKHLHPGESGIISENQISDHISAELWTRGMTPGSQLQLTKLKDGHYEISLEDGTSIKLPPRLARMVRIEQKDH